MTNKYLSAVCVALCLGAKDTMTKVLASGNSILVGYNFLYFDQYFMVYIDASQEFLICH